MKNLREYAVVCTYNFDNASEVTLFGSDYEGAKKYLRELYEEELRIEEQENEWEDVKSLISDDGTYAEIKHYVSDGVDTCEYRLCTNVRRYE